MSTTMLTKETVERKWYILDAAGKPMGKTAALAAKLEQKYYRTHSGYPGGLKETQYKILMQKKPELAMRLAVRGMLQKNTIAQWQLKRLRIFAGAEHTHAAQKPEVWDR